MIKKESSKVYDAGMAIDDVSFISCPLRRPTEGDCPNEEYKCQNKVLYIIYSERKLKIFSKFVEAALLKH